MPAIDLYAGGYWAIVRGLPSLAEAAGFKATLWVISAGYGLIPATTPIHSYSATFASSYPDSVAPSLIDGQSRASLLQDWWESLSVPSKVRTVEPHSFNELFKRSKSSLFLVIASPDYLQAIERDLMTSLSMGLKTNQLVIISSRPRGSNTSLDDYLVCSDARLLTGLGGARGSLHARVASMILENIETWGGEIEELRRRVDKRIARSPALKKYERRPMTDESIRAFIRRNLHHSPQPSCSFLLRQFRSDGNACEQGRFKRLYWEIKEGLYEA